MMLGFLMQGYGGCFNPPCRQRPILLKRFISRALLFTPSSMCFARPADGFRFFLTQIRPAVRVSATEAMLGYYLTFTSKKEALIKTCSASTTASNSYRQDFFKTFKNACKPNLAWI